MLMWQVSRASPTSPAHGWPIRAHLAMLAASLLVPAILFAAVLIERLRTQQLWQAEARLVQLAADLADDISVELERSITILQSLSYSGALERGELGWLHAHARNLLERTGDNFLLYDGAGSPLINTVVPFGVLPPNRADAIPFDILKTGQPFVSNLIWGRTRKTWVVNIMYPAVRGGELRYILVLSITADRIRQLLLGQELGPDWSSGVSGRNHVLIARTRLHDEFVGKPLTPELIAHSKVERTPHRVRSLDQRPIVRVAATTRVGNWTVATAVSERALYVGADAVMRDLVAAGLALLAISALGVGLQGWRIAGAIRGVVRPDRLPGGGVRRLAVREASEAAQLLAVATAELRKTSAELEQRNQALQLALSSASAIAFTWDIEADVVHRPFSSEPALATTNGKTDTLADIAKVVHPDDRSAFLASVAKALETPDEPYHSEYRLVRPDGEVRWLTEWGRVDRKDGKPVSLVGISVDTTQRKQAEQALVESERRFRELADSMPQLVWTADASGQVTYYNRRREEYLTGPKRRGDWQAIIHPDDLEPTKQRWSEAVANVADYECEHRVLRADGSYRWQLSRARPVRHSEGIVWYGTATDIQDLKEREERIRLLMKEVNHRAKNLLAVVLSVARQTSRAGSSEYFVERLTDRAQGLAASQDLLVASEWKGVELEQLVRTQLAHFADLIGSRITLSGPRVVIDANAAQVIGMALHELATNASKYGALSVPGGRVAIEWQAATGIESPRFALSWLELDGPAVSPPHQVGFGHTVLVQMAEHALGARVQLLYGKDGIGWSLDAPLDRVIEAGP